MTLPYEARWSVLRTAEFLDFLARYAKTYAGSRTLRKPPSYQITREARRLLRHFPRCRLDMEMAAKKDGRGDGSQ